MKRLLIKDVGQGYLVATNKSLISTFSVLAIWYKGFYGWLYIIGTPPGNCGFRFIKSLGQFLACKILFCQDSLNSIVIVLRHSCELEKSKVLLRRHQQFPYIHIQRLSNIIKQLQRRLAGVIANPGDGVWSLAHHFSQVLLCNFLFYQYYFEPVDL